MAKGQVGLFQAPRQLGFHGAQLHGVGARLKHRQNPFVGVKSAFQAVQRGSNGGGVVGKVVDHRDLPALRSHGATHLHAPLYVLKRSQGLACHLRRYAHMFCRRDRCQGIELVVNPAQSPMHMAHFFAVHQHVKVVRFADRCEVTHGGTKTAHFAPAAGVQNAGQAVLQAIDDHATGPGHGAYQVVKLAFNGGQVIKNVSVVKLEVVQHGGAGSVMHELAALVEKGGVVFVRFNDKGFALAQARGNPKVHGDAAHQKPRLPPCLLQNPSGHGGGRCFAVGAGDGDHMATLQNMLTQPLGAAGIG